MAVVPAFRGLVAALCLLLCLALAGCAAQQAFRDGQRKAAQGELRGALADFEKASALEPGSAEYRIATLRTRDRLLALQLTRAEQALERGQLDAAAQDFGTALALAPANDRALQGQRQVDRQRRWDGVLQQADAAAARRNWDQVSNLLRPLLLEAPGLRRARELQQQADAAAPDPGEAAERALAEAYRKPISIEFRETALRTIFEVLARSSGLNFILDRDVRGDQKASIFLKNSSIEAALSMLLAANQLEQRVLDAHSVLIYPATAAKQKEHQTLTVRSFYLANADAKTVAATLKTLLKVREAVVDEKLNLVIVRDTPQAVRLAAKVVALHDVADAEVMLDVEVLEIKRTRLLNLGVRWPDQLTLTPLPAAAGGALTLSDLRNLNSTSIGAALGSAGINAQDVETDANLLANPRIRARNREKARILIGERVPNITTTSTSTGFVSESVTYVDVGLKLEVEPTVYVDNEVAIRVALEVSNIISQVQTKTGTLAYQIGTRTASTVLRLKDGENQVLAGLINDEDRRTANKVPALGDVPLLGRLFGTQSDDAAKTEIVLSITPRILRSLQRPDALAQVFDSGTEAAVGGRGGDAAPVRNLPPPAAAQPASQAPTAGVPPAAAAGAGSPAAAGGVAAQPALAVAAGVGAEEPAAVRLRWAVPATARVGDTLTLQLLASSEQPVTALPLQLALDPRVLQILAVNEGNFLRAGNGSVTFSSQADTAGQVQINAARSGVSGATGATQEAALVTLTVKVLARPGDEQTQLRVLSLAPLGLAGRALTAALPLPQAISVLP